MNLRELIKTQKGARSYAALSADCGGYPSSKRLQQLATTVQKNFPDPVTVRALSRGLRVTEVTVVLASAEDLGLDVSRATPKVLDFLPAAVNELDDDQLFAIGNMIRTFIPVERQDDPTPAETALAEEVTYRIGHGQQSDYDLASRTDTGGRPVEGRGRQLRRKLDEHDHDSQDDGGMDPA